jgi:hypothetical protein
MSGISVSPAESRVSLARNLRAPLPGPGWLYLYIILQVLCQLALLLPSAGPVRVVLRSAAFGTSLLLFVIIPGSPLYPNSVRSLLVIVMVILGISWLNPEGGGFVAATAHWVFHLAIVAPMFWVARLRIDERSTQRLIILMWLFYAASASVGVLQATFPGFLQPRLAAIAAEGNLHQIGALSLQLSSGEWIIRPMGLTDSAGGAGYGGFYAVLLGLGVFLARPFNGARIAGLFSMLAGATAIYLCQIRALLVMLGVCLLALIAITGVAGKMSRALVIFSMAAIVAVLAFLRASELGGESVTGRISSLMAEDAATVYYRNRGVFIEHTLVELLPEYPFGAGLGRWGMMSRYFATSGSELWAEVQWTGWLFDGGVLLLVVYPTALIMTTVGAARLALRTVHSFLGPWAGIVFAYDIGALALTFSYPNFMATAGAEFWLLNAALFQAAGAATLRTESSGV